jgi:hypothetical protein
MPISADIILGQSRRFYNVGAAVWRTPPDFAFVPMSDEDLRSLDLARITRCLDAAALLSLMN